jgi:hypothetical protein
MGRRLSAALLAVFVVALLPCRPARAQSRSVVVLGLRPTRDGSFRATDLTKVAESQRLFRIVENVVQLVSGYQVVTHDQLQRLLGQNYVAGVFFCDGRVTCLVREASRLADKYSQVVVGDYFPSGQVYRFRFRRIDLRTGTVTDTASFSIEKAQLEQSKAWSAGLAPLFGTSGTVEVVASVPDYECRVDGQRCALDERNTMVLEQGEHLVELSRSGYLSASRVIEVQPRRHTRVAFALQKRSITAGDAPSRFKASLPQEKPSAPALDVFGRVQVSFMADPLNQGDVYDQVARPRSEAPRDWHLAVLPNHSFLGASVKTPRDHRGWQARGLVVIGMFTLRQLRVHIADAQVQSEDLGVRFNAGRLLQPTVNTLEPGTLSEEVAFGSLKYAMRGAKVTKELGTVVAELGVGKPEFHLLGETVPLARSSGPWPFAEGRIAYVDTGVEGRLYGRDVPLTVSVSGAGGAVRLGAGEADDAMMIDPSAAEPRIEDVPAWVASAELLLPLGESLLVAGEAYIGSGASAYGGALFQGPRLDLETGKHRNLESAGGWAQVAFSVDRRVEFLTVGGIEKVYDGFERGIALDQQPEIESNVMVAIVVAWYATESVRLAMQVHNLRTEYRAVEERAILSGGILDFQLNF